MKVNPGQNNTQLLYGAIGMLMVLPFLADLNFPLGTAVWVVYLFPAALAYLAPRPEIPLALAAATTLLTIIGYMFAPPGIAGEIALVNRTLGVMTCWVVAATGYVFIRNRLAVQREEWLRAGQVGLAKAVSGDQTLDQLGANIISFLADYSGASAGAIFIRDGDAFQRCATYGAPKGAAIPQSIGRGEGLLGDAIAKGRPIQLHDVPEGYLYFGSALGQSKPGGLAISLGGADGEINAVLELGYPAKMTDLDLELLERASETIGIAVRSAKYRLKLQELLEETQQQAEELQEQSEELRASNEELEAQSLSLQQSQARLEQQQAELEQTNAQLEEQTSLLEAQRDDLSRAQTVLRAQANDLEQTSRYKSEFVANMSHELRTPLNSLLILARLLAENRDGNLTPDQMQYARTIETSGHDLLNLINDILDLSKIEAGRLELQPAPVKVSALLNKLIATFQAIAAEKKVMVRSAVAPDVPEELETDPQRLEQVLKNFLSNAVKFTSEGEVVLSVAREAAGRVAFTVRDTGIGIPQEQQEIIFEAFRQADGTINRRYGGTGLGLSISRELARVLGGDIRLESAEGEGSAFTIVIPEIYDSAILQSVTQEGGGRLKPVVVQSAPSHSAATPTPLRTKRIDDDRERLSGDKRIILVVEDDVAFARILYDLAHELGFQCLVAESADEGVMVARQYLPSAVILDMALPDHSGLSVLDRLKRDTRTRHIPVHIVSVNDYTRTALSWGAVGYMLKPIRREELMKALRQLEERFEQRMRRVLIVEDNPDQLQSLQLLLATQDVQTVGALTAAECLDKLKAETFDCMVLDLSLPDATGFAVLEQLKLDTDLAFPPVIIHTGKDLSIDEEMQLRAFSKSIIIKGAKSPERLLDEVTLFLHQVVSDLPERQQRMLALALNRDAVLEGRNILVVEDDIRNVFALTSVLEPHGASVKIARNGREALQVLEQASTAGAQPVDLVLMDIMMPEMDGLTATREIRSRPTWKGLPIIALTAKAGINDHEQCLAAGANDYISKPLDVDKLLSLVRVWMPR